MKRHKKYPARLSLPRLLAVALIASTCFLLTPPPTPDEPQETESRAARPKITVAPKSTAERGKHSDPPPVPEEVFCNEASDPEAEADRASREADVEMLARVIWGEARGVASDMEKAAVAWCVLNRVDAEEWPDTVAEVVTQRYQFVGYSPDYPAAEELKVIAADVLIRWEREKQEGGDVGRVLPAEYTFFSGDGRNNHFRNAYSGGDFWDWTLTNPYNS